MCQSTASTNRCRARARLRDGIVRIGDKQRQAAALHDYLVNHDPALGQVLGVVAHPERSRAVAESTMEAMKEFLHSESVHRNTNEAISFQLTVFRAMVPAAPLETANRQAKNSYKRKMKDFIDEFELGGAYAERAKLASMQRREYNSSTESKQKLIVSYQRKSPTNTKLNSQLKRAFVDWCISKSDTIVCSPDKQDMKIARHPETNAKLRDPNNPNKWIMQRKFKYKGSQWAETVFGGLQTCDRRWFCRVLR